MAGMAALLLWSSGQVGTDYQLRYPAEVQRVVDQLAASCPKASPNADETEKELFWVTDLNGDGIGDYVVNQQYMVCFRFGVGDVATGISRCKRNCQAWVLLSGNAGVYRVAWRGRAFNMVRSGHDTLAAETRHGCQSMKCTFSLMWQDGKIVRKPGIH
jgi:hypothetical protein